MESELIQDDSFARRDDLHDMLESRLRQAEQAVLARDRFLSVAAHELRNPMAPLVLQVGRLRKAALQGDLERVISGLEWLEMAITRYVKRANVLLDVSRLAADRLKLEPMRFDISEWLEQFVAGITPLAEHTGSQLSLSLPGPLIGFWDRTAVEQIMENLLSNAIKFGAGRPISVALTRDGAQIRLSVSDKGPGIAQDDQGRIFAAFEAVMARAEGGGFGVGLWVTGRLAAAMGGSVELDSAPREGATFTVILPIEAPDPDDDV
jgi:signal transduction histidine kinase